MPNGSVAHSKKGCSKGAWGRQRPETPAQQLSVGKHGWSRKEGPRAVIISCGNKQACWQHLRCVQAFTGMEHTDALVLKVNPEVARPELKTRTGMDDDVVQFIMEQAGSADLVLHVFKSVMPGSQSGTGVFSSKVALVSCRSGRHRSVAVAEMAADWRSHLIGPTVACHMGQLSAEQCEEQLADIQQWLAKEHGGCIDHFKLLPERWPRGLDLLADYKLKFSEAADTAFWDCYQEAQTLAYRWQEQCFNMQWYSPSWVGGYALGHQFPEGESLWPDASHSSSSWLQVATPGLEHPMGLGQDPVQQDSAHKESVPVSVSAHEPAPAEEDKEVNGKWVLPRAKPKAKAAVPGLVTLKATPKSSSISPKAMPRPKSPPMKRKANEVQAPTTSATEAEAEADAPRRQRLNSQTAEATSHGTCQKNVEQSPAKQWVIAERFEWLADWETTFLHKGMSEINKNRFRHVLNMVNPSEQRDYLMDRFLKNLYFCQANDIEGWTSKALRQLVLESWDEASEHEYLPDMFYDVGRFRKPVTDELRELHIWLRIRKNPPRGS